MAQVIVLCGKVGGGNAHITRQLAEAGACVVLSCDELEQARYDDALGRHAGASAAQCKEKIIRHAVELAQGGVNVLLDLFLPTPDARGHILDTLRAAGIETQMIYVPGRDMDPDAFLEARRLRAQETQNPFLESDRETLSRINDRFQVPAAGEDCLLFT